MSADTFCPGSLSRMQAAGPITPQQAFADWTRVECEFMRHVVLRGPPDRHRLASSKLLRTIESFMI